MTIQIEMKALRKGTLRAAQAWWDRLEDAQRIEDEWPGFQRWLAADSANRAAFLQLENTARSLERLVELRPAEGVDYRPLSGAAPEVEARQASSLVFWPR